MNFLKGLSSLSIFLLASCAHFNRDVLSNSKYASGREYETGKPIPPKLFQFGSYTFVTGNDSSKSSLGMYYRGKEIFFEEESDGEYDTIIKANFNNDGIPDFLIVYAFEDGESLSALISKNKNSFIRKEIGDVNCGTYCAEFGDTVNHLQCLYISDVNHDGMDEVITNLAKINNKLIAISCTDTIFVVSKSEISR